ncbi:MAG: PAS domain S-box protein [Acidobacteriota bacterium]
MVCLGSGQIGIAAGGPPVVLLGNRDFPPLSYLERGEPRGFDVDVAMALEKAIGREIRVELMDWGLARDRVLRGDANGLLDLGFSEERARQYDFTETTVTHEFRLFVRTSEITLNEIGALDGKLVGVTPGGFPQALLGERSRARLATIQNYSDGFDQLAAGAVDAFAGDTWVAAYILQRRRLSGVGITGEPLATVPASIALRKGQPELLSDINRGIGSLKADGTLQRIQDKWRPQEMLFLTRERVERLVVGATGGVLLLLLAAMGAWVLLLKKHIKVRKLAEAAARASEERFAKAFQASPDCIAITDLGLGTVLEVNERFEEMTGYARTDILGRTLVDIGLLVNPSDRDAYLPVLRESGRIRDHEMKIRRKDGEVRTWLMSAEPIETGGRRCFLTVNRDVTLQQQAQEALRASEEKFARAFQVSPDCIAISNMTGVIEINASFEEMSGYQRSEIIGKNITELGIASGAVRDAFLAELLARGSIRNFEYVATRKDGGIRHILLSAQLIQLGGEQCFLSVNRDITGYKLAEEALQRSEAKYRELVENANDAIFTIDREGYCLSMNRVGQELTEYGVDDPRGTHLTQLVAPEDLAEVERQLQRVLSGEDVAPFEVNLISKSGKRLSLELSSRPLFDHGAIVASQAIARDVTRRRELEAQLRQAQKMDAVGRLAAGVAHDFNNLLTVILGNCEASAPLLAPHGRLREAFADIRSAAERAASLTGQLLAFSRREMTKPAVFNLDEVIADLERMLARLIGENIESRFIPGQVGSICADLGQLQQVVMNLAVNARDAMPSGGRLTIETQNVHLDGDYVQRHRPVPAGHYVMLAVSDTGLGMTDETRARLFEPFFTTKEVGKGTGLGLATVYGIVKQSGGFIWVYSELGLGSTFKIYFPRVQAPATSVRVEPVQDEVLFGDERVLLVEDEEDLRDLLHDYLAAQGYTVKSASSGEDALAVCRDHPYAPAILISDVVMPGIGGRALADRLRLDDPELKVLYLSGYTDEAMLRHGILPTGTQFLQKPFALEALARTVRLILDEPQSAETRAFITAPLA